MGFSMATTMAAMALIASTSAQPETLSVERYTSRGGWDFTYTTVRYVQVVRVGDACPLPRKKEEPDAR